MAPHSTIHLVRHAQGWHQLPLDHPNENLRDPELTPYGESQSAQLCSRFERHSEVDLLCASPMRRAIRTALIAFAPGVARGLRIVALPDAQEATAVLSDTGSPVDEVKPLFGDAVDWGLVGEGWFEKTGENAVDMAALEERARRLRRWLRGRDEREIVVVTHGFFAHFLTGNIDAEGKQTGEWWLNVRERSFNFVSAEDEDAEFVETEESKKKSATGENSAEVK